ncbi:MAG: pyridoxamine 5'-phosphate oxidase family protein [Oscillospiraceae bacterium]|nr:pyridoxamine 5'-phosphate oxidase family protein [Oscillospiraceae bacterium]
MDTFSEKYEAFLLEFGKGRKMALSTSVNNKVSSRMMSVVLIDGKFCFQTDATSRKYRQLSANRNAALCTDNIQIEGICYEIGHPLDNAPFCSRFQECYKGSYDAYTSLKNERLFALDPTYIERWVYKDKIPYIERFDLKARSYEISEYIGI